MQTIREHREGRGWTQFALALKVGVQPQAVSLWERGRRTPEVLPLRQLGVLFGLCSDDIVLAPRGDAAHAPPHPLADRQDHADARLKEIIANAVERTPRPVPTGVTRDPFPSTISPRFHKARRHGREGSR